MNGLKRLALVCALMAAAVAGMTATAQASRGFGVSPAGTMTSSGTVTFTASGLTIICTVSITETIPRSISKVVGSAATSVTAATLSGCNLGITATFLFGTPWAGTYTSFTGTLPNITELNGMIGTAGMQLNIPGIGRCLYARGLVWKWLVVASFIAIRRITWQTEPLEGPILCPPLNGRGDLTPTPRNALTLI